ncbi:Ca2+-dependent phosphoinositide-specific phospholipase C [Alteromonas sp. AMM-1]|uniref:Ca2+-dependent phosphoinositide-specific phospholipase C n=1 Tax=Alteromonas sp. AMM-1 TaxID=3394233 RepID=UPI0039A5C2F0
MRFFSLIGLCLLPVLARSATLSDYQIIGSHNSYKRALPPSLFAQLQSEHPRLAQQINYHHPTLAAQLALGLRQLEIDVVNDPEGNQYDTPEMARQLNEQWLTTSERQALAQPGFKVLHIPHVDVLSHCVVFKECLNQLKNWSNSNPQHFPIMVMLNAKENQPGFVSSPEPAPFTAKSYQALDAEIRLVMQDKLVTPDAIRGEFNQLSEAVRRAGWPDIDSLRGKFIFLFDANPSQRDLYAQGYPSLRGRSMFASYPSDSDEAAIMVRNEPNTQFAEIRKLIQQGFLVRTRAEADFSATPAQMQAQFEAAQRSGAQFISTDFYHRSPQSQQTGHVVRFDDGALVRANPFTQ